MTIKSVQYYINVIFLKIRKKMFIKNNEELYYNVTRKYVNRKVLPKQEVNQAIISMIQGDEPIMIGRFGSTELMNLATYDFFSSPQKREKALEQLGRWSGFFPLEIQALEKFTILMKQSCKQVNLLAIWDLPMESHYIQKYMNQCNELTWLGNLDPWNNPQNPWTKALKGKKVLVIHPFAETIEKQYRYREHLWNETPILPEFELCTITAVQTLADEIDPRFSSWFEALDFMFEEAMNQDFDIALIGCGAYGFPLAAKIRESGKKAIHIGGSLQILFGIRGRRWDDSPVLTQYYNEYWTRPTITENISNLKSVENGCYW